uniref:Uncharacterized protein n=1 Tax=Myoviridae sp. ctwVB15 TaxID=2825208 RepID=A0A8S5UNB3_9CAUD|nr:MAG TPA: hypothetical protein [Myoviridae sp. ctwVB15]
MVRIGAVKERWGTPRRFFLRPFHFFLAKIEKRVFSERKGEKMQGVATLQVFFKLFNPPFLIYSNS